MPIPDLTRTDLLVMMGANPVVSHGSFLTAPRIKDRMHDIVKRGGRVVVIDPRSTETAAEFEWLGIVPDADAYLLLSLLQVMFADGLVDLAPRGSQADGMEWLQALCEPFTPEVTAAQTGIERRASARSRAISSRTPRAAVYGTVRNLCRPVRHADHLPDRRGQSRRGKPRHARRFRSSARWDMPGQRWQKTVMGVALRRSYRASGHASADSERIGSEPAALMAKEITTPGDRQIKAMFVSAGNPVLSVPNGDELEAAFEDWNFGGLDFYVTETTARCDYVLPVTTMYERDDFPYLPGLPGHPVPSGHRGRRGAGRSGAHRVGHRRGPDESAGSRTPVFAAFGRCEKRLAPSASRSRRG